jgi:hypothetical protein
LFRGLIADGCYASLVGTEHNFEVLEASGNAVVNAILEARLTDREFCKENVLEDVMKERKRRSRFVKKKYKMKKYAEGEKGSDENSSRSREMAIVASARPDMAKSLSLPSLLASTQQSLYGPKKHLVREADALKVAGWNQTDVSVASKNILSPSPNQSRWSSAGGVSSKTNGLSDIAGNNHALSHQKRSSSFPALEKEGKPDKMERSRNTYLPATLLPATSIRASEKAAKVHDLREKWAVFTASPLVW